MDWIDSSMLGCGKDEMKVRDDSFLFTNLFLQNPTVECGLLRCFKEDSVVHVW